MATGERPRPDPSQPNDLGSTAARHYLDAAPDAIIAVRYDGVITMANDRAVELFGYPRADLVGLDVDVLVPDGARRAHQGLRSRYTAHPRLRQMGDPRSRLRARAVDGSLLPVEIALSPVESDDGQTIMAVIRDVSERVAAEAEYEGIRRSLDAVADAVFMFDPATLEFTYTNAGASAQTGYSRAELVGGMTPLQTMTEFDELGLQKLLEPLLNEVRSSITFETGQRTSNDADVPVEVVLSWPHTDHDLARPLVAIVRDITQRRAAEDRLRSSEAAFRSAFEDAAVPMAMLDVAQPGHQTIIRANESLAELLGSSVKELTGVEESHLTHPADRSATADRTTALLSGKSGYQLEKRYRTSDGSYRWVAVDASLIEATTEGPRVLLHIVDVTRRIQAEHDRDRREELLVTLASVRKAVLNEVPIVDVLQHVVDGSSETLDASVALIATPSADGALELRAQSGPQDLGWFGSALLDTDAAQRVQKTADIEHLDILMSPKTGEPIAGPIIVVPLRTANSVEGLLAIARAEGAASFDDDDLDLARSLAAEAAVSLVLARAREDRRRMLLVEDRDRIARDLHDVVIQRLFATGMRLQAVTDRPDLLRERVTEAVQDLDLTIADIRNSIFHLTPPDESVVGELQRLIDRHRAVGRNEVVLELEGDVAALVPETVDNLLPVVNELLSNVERHAQATTALVAVTVGDGRLSVTVTDDGIGLAHGVGPGFGLRNLRRRADSLGGEFEYGPRVDGSGTESGWSVPLPSR